MDQIFVGIYNFFNKRKSVFWAVFITTIVLISWSASRIEFEEDITKFFPDDDRVEKLNYVFRNSKFVERVVVMVSVKDSTSLPQPDSLEMLADSLVETIWSDLKPYVKKITAKVDDDKVLQVFNSIEQYLPLFLDDKDYRQLDSLTRPDAARQTMRNNYHLLVSPSGIVTKKIIMQDPLGFSFLALKKLQQLQYDDNFELYDNYIVTKDHRHLIFFLQPAYSPTETKHNADFVDQLKDITKEATAKHQDFTVSYFGAAVVAVGNAQQIRKDTLLTVSIMLVLLMIIILGYFRKKRTPFIMLVPVLFGGLFSLGCIALTHGTLSVLAIAVGAIILGIAINYALHYLVLLKIEQSATKVIKELARPLTIGSTTTVLAFLCLQFTNARVLGDIGLFAGLSLVGAALCSLIFLPHLVREDLFEGQPRTGKIQKLAGFSFESNKYLVYGILLLTPVFFFFAGQVRFNTDMGKLNFMKAETREAQQRLESISRSSLTAVYVVSSGKTLEHALRQEEQTMPVLHRLKDARLVNKMSAVSTFLLSDSLQKIRIKKWHSFWNTERIAALRKIVSDEGTKLHFSQTVIHNFDSMVMQRYKPMDYEAWQTLRTSFFDDYIIEKDGQATVVTLANVSPENKKAVYEQLSKTPSHGVDRQMMTNMFVEYVHSDFNFIVTFTSVFVFFALLISYGRIELTLMTFVPMLITWIWILGIMALAGIEFNIINVMVSTFIFGLGDDYSIFIMDGLQQEYRAGKKALPAIRASIFLSALTTICGLGVLIFAEHPALKSIAAISIIGIACVFMMAQTIEPFLFRLLITNRTAKGYAPATFKGICIAILTYGFFTFGALVLTITGWIMKLIPFAKGTQQRLYHRMISFFTGTLIAIAPNARKQEPGRTALTFARASVIIANHSSFLDILLTTSIHPKVILLTNQWVWKSPVFGAVVRMADYYPVEEGAEDSIARLKGKVAEGYSVVIFPEGTRSNDGKIHRFHKGAFFLAEQLSLPIQPLLIHGASLGVKKGELYLNDCELTLKYLPPIELDDVTFGTTYAERTKKISRYFKDEYTALAREKETPDYFVYWLVSNYIYKGPVLEWYLRIKLRLEKNYAPFNALVPRQATVLDLGCGYGFLCYMLQFLSDERTITGVDYDEEKIETAQHGYLKSDRLSFYHADVTQFPLQKYDVIIISDVLHYLSTAAQQDLLIRCFGALNAGGKIIVRDGNADLQKRHTGTRVTEFFSINILRFNKANTGVNFISGNALHALAGAHGMEVSVLDDTKFTSNVIFVIQKSNSAATDQT